MNIPHHIHNLLFSHDCVIVPGLGGFLTNTRSSSLNPAQHTFSPPCKRVAFNAGLKNNDGLLGNHLAGAYGVSYAEAMVEINTYVEETFNKLQSGKRVWLEKIGSLELDRGLRLQFEPDMAENFLVGAFGLGSIHSPAIRREEAATKRNREISLPKERKIRFWRVVEVIPVAAILTILFFNPKVIPALNNGLAQLLPVQLLFPSASSGGSTENADSDSEKNSLDEGTDENVIIDTIEQQEQPDTMAFESESTEVSPDSAEASPDVHTGTSSVMNEPDHASNADAADNNSAIRTTGSGRGHSEAHVYHVVGGCFRIEENAEQFLLEAQQSGYAASNLGRKFNGLYVVSLFASDNREEAVREQQAVKTSGFISGAWILEK